MIELRVARPADAAALAFLHRTTVTLAYRHIFPPDAAPPSLDELTGLYDDVLGDPASEVLIAVDDADVIVGAAALVPDPDVPAGWRLERFNVLPRHQSAGVGRRLHDAILDTARRRGLPRLALWVLEGNTRARAIYEHWGWRRRPGWTLANEPPEILDVLYEIELATTT